MFCRSIILFRPWEGERTGVLPSEGERKDIHLEVGHERLLSFFGTLKILVVTGRKIFRPCSMSCFRPGECSSGSNSDSSRLDTFDRFNSRESRTAPVSLSVGSCGVDFRLIE